MIVCVKSGFSHIVDWLLESDASTLCPVVGHAASTQSLSGNSSWVPIALC